jgi:hypothetical protein
MIATQSTVTLAAAKSLPSVLQEFVYEFATGSADYRRHKFRYRYVLSELRVRLKHKLAMEAKVLALDSFLGAARCSLNKIESITYSNIDLGAFGHQTNGSRYIRAFSPQSKTLVFRITWCAGIRGPDNVSVTHDARHGWVYMTPNFFQPTSAERAGMHHAYSTTVRTHRSLQEFGCELTETLAMAARLASTPAL